MEYHLSSECPVAARVICSICNSPMPKYMISNHYKTLHPNLPIPATTSNTSPQNYNQINNNIREKSSAYSNHYGIVNQIIEDSEELDSPDESINNYIY